MTPYWENGIVQLHHSAELGLPGASIVESLNLLKQVLAGSHILCGMNALSKGSQLPPTIPLLYIRSARAAYFLQLPQLQDDPSLLPLNSQVLHELLSTSGSFSIRNLPNMHVVTSSCLMLNSHRAAKGLSQKVRDNRFHLFEANAFMEYRHSCVSPHTHCIGIPLYGEVPIGIETP